MTIEEQLKGLGLGKNEAKVYLAVLELGATMVGEIQDVTDLHKQLIYNAAEKLEKKNLMIIFEERGRKHFKVSDPSMLAERHKERYEQAKGLIPKLFERAGERQSADTVKVYRGQKGVHQYYLEVMRQQPEESEALILGVNSERYFKIFDKEMPAYRRMEAMRVEKQITWKLLLFAPKEDEVTKNRGREFVEVRVLPEAVQAPNDIMVWHNRVGMLFYADEPYVVDIMGADVVEGFQQYFGVLWERAERNKKEAH